MAAWGNMMNIFENPLADSLSSWSQLLPKPDGAEAPFGYMFGELCHSVNPPEPPSAPTTAPPPLNKSLSWKSTLSEPGDSALEILGELFYKTNPPETEDRSSRPDDQESTEGAVHGDGNDVDKEGGRGCAGSGKKPATVFRRCYSDGPARSSGGCGGLMKFPPPITTIGRCGKPRLYFKSYRKDGRFVLREIRIPTQHLLHSTRENGRLRMQVVAHDDDNDYKFGGRRERHAKEDEEEGQRNQEKKEKSNGHRFSMTP